MTYDEGFAAGMRRAAEIALLHMRDLCDSEDIVTSETNRTLKDVSAATLAAIPPAAPWTPPEDRPDYPNEDCPKCGGEGVDADPHGLFDGSFVKPCRSCWPAQEDTP